ncbi:AAA family ATPase [Metabacillus sp. GX 13764]|uniref:AAA family ATPase n=1 Tax=Metabacillus kandeliae TaxID=2900151 RepID=UPI001E633BB2|nr:AAA family ATPase [Metabacillus kandeliae]MCD7034288.1 AAA family ATPase [Metabacillus kandeliae]
MYKHGLVFGKFYPFHKGHHYLIKRAIAASDHVTIVVCSLLSETIPGVLRHAWVHQAVKEMLAEEEYKGKTADVLHLDKTVPQEPSEHPDFWGIWTDLLEGYLTPAHPAYDALFTSEEYGFQMADCLNCKHVLVDKERLAHPVSGTLCRQYLTGKAGTHPEFTPFFQEYADLHTKQPKPFQYRFVIVGSESSGKSTMTETLAEKLNAIGVQEYGRTYTDQFPLTGIQDFYILLQKQLHLFLHTPLEAGKNQILICDTDAIVTQTFADLYYPLREKEFDVLAEKHILSYKEHTDLYLFLKPTVKWVDDGTRLHEEYREFAAQRIKDRMDKHGIPYAEIDHPDYETRVAIALDAIFGIIK